MPSLLRASIGVAGALAVGCSAPVVDDMADASGAMTEGVVLVERMVAGDGATQTNVSAKFMRLSTPVDPDLAERLVGAKLDLPAAGTCRPLVGEPGRGSPNPSGIDGRARSRNALGTIELIDVGDITLRVGNEARTPLAVRAFPDIGDLVSGMFYTSRDTASDLPAGATYTLEGTGSGQVDRFTVDAEAPAALEDVRIGGAPLLDGVTLDEGAPFTVRWRSGDPKDLVLVEVGAASGASIRCSFPDEGQGVLPAWILRTSTLGALPATATLSVHRVRGRAFVAPGIDTGEVRFDLSVMGRISVGARSGRDGEPGRGSPNPSVSQQ